MADREIVYAFERHVVVVGLGSRVSRSREWRQTISTNEIERVMTPLCHLMKNQPVHVLPFRVHGKHAIVVHDDLNPLKRKFSLFFLHFQRQRYKIRNFNL